MSNIDKQALRQLATDAHELGIIKRYTKGIEANKRFAATATPLTFLALLDELEGKDKKIAEQQRSLDRREFLLLSADQVQREYAEALGCAGDNESILEAIDDMKKHIAELELARIALASLTAEPEKCGHVNLDCDDGKAVCLSCGNVWEV